MSNATSAANATIVLSSGGMIVATVNEYATIISLTIGALGLLTGLFFHVMTWRDRKRKEKEDVEKIKREAVEEYISLNKLDKG